MTGKSIVEYYAEHERYKCGYCGSLDTNFSHGMVAHTMTVRDYEDLIDRGWRRSGRYCYKPTMDITCCPMYTIRCRALEFKLSKSQKKVLKRFNNYLTGKEKLIDVNGKMSTSSSLIELSEKNCEGRENHVENTRQHQNIDINKILSNKYIEGAGLADKIIDAEGLIKNETEPKVEENLTENSISTGQNIDQNKSPCKKAKQLRRERKLEKLKQKGIDISTLNEQPFVNKEKQIEDIIQELSKDAKYKFEIKLVRTAPPSPEWLATAKATHEVYVKYQTKIHNDKPDKCTESKFSEFLVSSPLMEEYSETGPACGYGSFHQQYWLDNKLVAVGVIDILPKCVSSVYFFYDPDYMNLTMGTYGALREIEFTRKLHLESPRLQYYYMGFYIHTCTKMRYKGNFHPSDLLCPETYNWFPIKESITKLELSPYSRLDSNIDNVDLNHPNGSDINYIPVLYRQRLVLYKVYKKAVAKKKENEQENEEIREYARLVGARMSKNLILVR